MRRWPLRRGRDRVLELLGRAMGRYAHAINARTAYGAVVRCDLRDLVQSRIHDFGVWEPNLTAFISANLRPGDVFVDVGANIGYFTLLAAKVVGPSGSVVAVDASPRIFGLLTEGLSFNAVSNVRAVNAAISDRPGTLKVYLGDESNLGRTSTLAERGGTFEAEVPALRLIDLLLPAERAHVRLIKIDVEGAEGPILGDIVATVDQLSSLRSVVVEISPESAAASGWPIGQIIDAFSALGFSWSTLDNNYDLSDYLTVGNAEPTPGREIPTEQVDVVFTRVR